MLLGKVVQLLGIPSSEEFEIIYGIHTTHTRYFTDFATIKFMNTAENVTKTYMHDYHIKEEGDGFKEILVFNGELSSDHKEEGLLVIIHKASQLITNSKKIAGRTPCEAILEMHNGDIVEVSKKHTGKRDVYMAVQAGNEMFLIKKNR